MCHSLVIFTGQAGYPQTRVTVLWYLLGRQCTLKQVSQSGGIYWADSVPSIAYHSLVVFTGEAVYLQTSVTVWWYLLDRHCTFKHISQSCGIYWAGSELSTHMLQYYYIIVDNSIRIF